MKSMKLPDVNIWFALSVKAHPCHTSSEAWLNEQEDADSIRFCRPTQQGFMRLLTTASVMKIYDLDPANNQTAWKVFETYCDDDRIAFADEPPGIEETWKSLALRKTSSPKLWMDAYLAAFAINSGFQLVTADKAFTQFKGLDLQLIK
jgi:toxin-antitoxin system PIN domain toxin